jgi:hypothetical protein
VRPLKAFYALIPGVVIAATLVPPAASAATREFTVSGSQILKNGVAWTPKGFTLSTFQDGPETWARGEFGTVTAQLRAIAGAWHGNTVRLQIEQDEFVYGGGGQSATTYRDKVYAVISYAESLGLAVVINDQTETQQTGLYSHNEPLPTADTLKFWRLIEGCAKNPDVIIDPFNEPRHHPANVYNAAEGWAPWFSGTSTYIGEDALIRDLRADGYTNQIWAEAPSNFALTELGVTWPHYKLTDPGGDLAYTFHHPSTDETNVPTTQEWNVEFGNLVTVRNLPVVDGEWTNRSVPYGTEGTVFEPSGDTGQCWGNAPVSVPAYLAYLRARHIGMTVWTLGTEAADGYPAQDYINADGDNSTFTSANNYSDWKGCVTPKGAATSGAGQDIMNWFATLSS